MKIANRGFSFLVAVLLLPASTVAQEDAGKGLSELIRGNEQFGRKLLLQVHSIAADRNVVVSPISLTLIFAAFREHSWNDDPLGTEIDRTFGWKRSLRLNIPARQLLAAFEEPAKPKPCPPHSRTHIPCFVYVPEGAWITNTFLYRSAVTYVNGVAPEEVRNPIDEGFAEDAKKNFKFRFVHTGIAPPSADDLRQARKHVGALPNVSPRPLEPENDVWVSSGTHLQTAWRGNTFSINRPYQGEFRTASGAIKVQLLDSEMAEYFYAKTSTFEAVALPCNLGYMLVVLPVPEKDIHELEREMVDHPGAVDAALTKQLGEITMPTFRIGVDSDLSLAIGSLGIHTAFQDLNRIFKIGEAGLTKVAQKIDLEVSQNGIRADAETVAAAVYGGIITGREPFHMSLTRPFVFLIRDQTTGALLFIGAVMDPSQQTN